jgi:hypothetical protein
LTWWRSRSVMATTIGSTLPSISTVSGAITSLATGAGLLGGCMFKCWMARRRCGFAANLRYKRSACHGDSHPSVTAKHQPDSVRAIECPQPTASQTSTRACACDRMSTANRESNINQTGRLMHRKGAISAQQRVRDR